MLARVLVLVVLGFINVAIFGRMIWGDTGIMEYRELKQQYNSLRERIANLDAENMAISREIRLLQSDRQYVEKVVRQKLHYLRDNEVVYLFVEPAVSRSGANSDDRKN